MTMTFRSANPRLTAVLEQLEQVRPNGRGYVACCPAHVDRTPSLSVAEGQDGRVLVRCHAGCGFSAVAHALGLTESDFFAPAPAALAAGPAHRPTEVAAYDYRAADGTLLFQVARYEPKDFRQRRPNPQRPGSYLYHLDDVPRVLYRLPAVLAAVREQRPVLVVEGEKDADALTALGYVATTNVGGAKKWSEAYGAVLGGTEVVVLPDNDDAGRQHADQVAATCSAHGSPVRIVRLPDLPAKGDVSDWLAAGGTLDALDALIEATPLWHLPRSTPDDAHPAADNAGAVVPNSRPDGYSDDALALGFAELQPHLRFIASTSRWSRYADGVWREDDTLSVYDDVRAYLRAAAVTIPKGKKAKLVAAVRSAKTVSAVERMARSDRRIAATVEQFDCDPWSLNTPGGRVDLRTGVTHPNRPEDYCSRRTAVAPAPDAATACPRWRVFLERATGGDAALELFLQKMAGYCLTGSIEEHALFFLYGTGGNGKGVFLNTLARTLGDYARVAPIETFTATRGDRHPTELAMLRGSRLVAAQETEEGRQWAEAKLKSITGGDPITARFMRGDFFTYEPQFKLVIAGNHQPHLHSVDEAIRRRLHLVPFEQTIPAEERDPELPDKLRAEWPGILAWMIEGCARWMEEGLRPPDVVQTATNEYFEAEDALSSWIQDCCSLSSMAEASSAELFAIWRGWAERAGEEVTTLRRFSAALRKKGFAAAQVGHARLKGFRGIAVRPNTKDAYLNA